MFRAVHFRPSSRSRHLFRLQGPEHDRDHDPLLKRDSVAPWTQDTAGGGVRSRSPLMSPPRSTKAGAAGGSGGGAEAGAAARGGRELSFWGFVKQLSSHANFWL